WNDSTTRRTKPTAPTMRPASFLSGACCSSRVTPKVFKSSACARSLLLVSCAAPKEQQANRRNERSPYLASPFENFRRGHSEASGKLYCDLSTRARCALVH